MRGKESRRAANTDDRYRDREPKTVSHVEPGSAALRLGLIARVTREAKSGAFM
jgi:hypothetical protein